MPHFLAYFPQQRKFPLKGNENKYITLVWIVCVNQSPNFCFGYSSCTKTFLNENTINHFILWRKLETSNLLKNVFQKKKFLIAWI